MDKDNRQFTPEQVDEQINQLLQRVPTSQNELLIDDLQNMYRDDEHSLENVWQRLGLQGQTPTQLEPQREPVECIEPTTGSLPIQQIGPSHAWQSQRHQPGHTNALDFERNQRMQQIQKNSLTRKLSLAAAVFVAAIVVGSVIFAFVLSRQSTLVASPSNTQQQTQPAATLPKGLYISDQSNLSRMDTSTHKMLWQQAIKNIQRIVTDNNTMYVLQGSDHHGFGHTVIAVDENSGNQLWKHSFDKLMVMDIAIANNQLYVSTYSVSGESPKGQMQAVGQTSTGQIYVLNAHDGSQRTMYPAINAAWQLALDNNILVVGAGQGLLAYDTTNGKTLWEATIKAPSNEPVLAVRNINGVVYALFSTNDEAGAGISYIAAYKASNGRQIWRSPNFPASALLRFNVDHNVVYFGATDYTAGKNLFKATAYAYDVQQNKQLWKHDIDGGTQTTPLIDNGVVYFTSDRGSNDHAYITALATADGSVKWQKSLKYQFADATPGMVDGELYVGDNDMKTTGELVALKPGDGSQQWTGTFDSAPITIPTR